MHTDRPRYSVFSNITVMRPNNNIIKNIRLISYQVDLEDLFYQVTRLHLESQADLDLPSAL